MSAAGDRVRAIGVTTTSVASAALERLPSAQTVYESLPSKGTVVKGAAVAVVGGAVASGAVVVGVAALGFSGSGIVAGSRAAAFMAWHGGLVPAGSVCAMAQSIGAVGMSGTVTAVVSAAGGVASSSTYAIARRLGGGSGDVVPPPLPDIPPRLLAFLDAAATEGADAEADAALAAAAAAERPAYLSILPPALRAKL